jgi:hypothetical protein
MGDRGNVVVLDQFDGEPRCAVYLYAHWGGSSIPGDVWRALARNERWSDGSYLTRIVFDSMTEGQQGDATGHGIGTRPDDNEHPFVVLDPATQRLAVRGKPGDAAADHSRIREGEGLSFSEFVAAGPEGLKAEGWR